MLDKIDIQKLENSPFHQACAEGNLQKCQELFAINPQIVDAIHPGYFTTGLAFAVQNNQVSVVKWLLENNASIYCKRPNFVPPKSQLVDMPITEDNKSGQTAFSFCSSAEIYSLLNQSAGTLTQSQRIVIGCEKLMFLLYPELSQIDLFLPILDNIQSVVTKTIYYTDEPLVALNALAKTFFVLGAYTQAQFLYQSVWHLLTTKKYQDNPNSAIKLDRLREASVVAYNLNVVNLKINEKNGQSIAPDSFTKNFMAIGDTFVSKLTYLEIEQCYKKAIFHCNVDNKELQTELYLKLLKNYGSELDGFPDQQRREVLIKSTQEYLNIFLELARETPGLDKNTALTLKTILGCLSFHSEAGIIAEFCKKLIAMDIKNNDLSWIYLDIYLITAQVNLQTPIDEDIFKNILAKSREFATELADSGEYWTFLYLLCVLGDSFSRESHYVYAEQCYKAVFDLTDAEQLEDDSDDIFMGSCRALIETRLKLGMKITADIVDKFLAINIPENHDYSLVSTMSTWKEAADMLFANENYAEAEQFYKIIFELMFSASWKYAIEFADESHFNKLAIPIEAGFNLVVLQIRRGMEIQEVLDVLFQKIKRMNQVIETVDELDDEIESALLKQVSLLFNELGERISSEKDDQTFHLATQCFLSAYETALKNDRGHYSDVNPTLQKLLTHYQSMGKKSEFIISLLRIFSPELSPVNIKQNFHTLYVSCINAIDNANKSEIQFFTAVFNCMEKFANRTGRKSRDNCVVLWQDFFEKGNNKTRFLQLHEKLNDSQQNSVKRKSSENLSGNIVKKSKIEIQSMEDDSMTVEEQPSLDSVKCRDQQHILQKIPYSYSQSANGFNHFFSIQQNNKQKTYKSAHHFDFDQTLTKVHVHDWSEPPSAEECKSFLKPETIKTLRFILQSGNYVSIITNGTAYRVSWVLQQAGLTQEEVGKISIHAAASPTIVSNFKPDAIRDRVKVWDDAKHHYFYDDREIFCSEVWKMKQELEDKGKRLHVTRVSQDANDCSHLAYAYKKAAEYSNKAEPLNEKEIIDNREPSLK